MRAPALALLAPALLLSFAAPARAQDDNGNTNPAFYSYGTGETGYDNAAPNARYEDAPYQEKYAPMGAGAHNQESPGTVEKFTDPQGRYSQLLSIPTDVGAGQGSGRGIGTVSGTGSGLSATLTPPPSDEDEPPPPPIRRPTQQAAQQRPPAAKAGSNGTLTRTYSSNGEQASGETGPITPAQGAKWGSTDKNGGGSAAPGSDTSTSKQAVGKAVKDAAAMIEGFKGREGGMGDFSGAGAGGAGGMPAAGAGAMAAGAAGGAAAKLDPAAQLAQSAAVYHDAFAAAGIKPAVGPGGRTVLLRADGTQATPADIAALQARIDREPTILASDPNMYRTISRERYAQLQNDYQTRPDLKDSSFKDVAMKGEKKDFLWGRDCEPVGGDCNKAAKKAYKKDKPVTADELERIWESVDAEAKQEESAFNKSKLNGAGIGALASALQGMLGFGSRSAPPSPDAVYLGGAGETGAPGASAAASGGGAAASAAARSRRADAGDPPSMSLAAALPARSSGRSLAAVLAAAGLLLLVAAVRARRA